MKNVVGDYLRDRFEWFVFDVVELGTELKTKEAIQYRFPTRMLYYPLRITRSQEGDTHVRLLVLSPDLVRLPDLGNVRLQVKHEPILVSPEDVRSLGNEGITEMLKERTCQLRIWEVSGRLSAFKKDILTSAER